MASSRPRFHSVAIACSLSLVLACGHAAAGTVTCSGTIDQLAYHQENRLMIRLSSMNQPVFFCNTDVAYSAAGSGYSIGPGACRTLYATFLAAKLAGKQLTNVYFDGTAVPATCSGFGSWSEANIRYFSLNP